MEGEGGLDMCSGYSGEGVMVAAAGYQPWLEPAAAAAVGERSSSVMLCNATMTTDAASCLHFHSSHTYKLPLTINFQLLPP